MPVIIEPKCQDVCCAAPLATPRRGVASLRVAGSLVATRIRLRHLARSLGPELRLHSHPVISHPLFQSFGFPGVLRFKAEECEHLAGELFSHLVKVLRLVVKRRR